MKIRQFSQALDQSFIVGMKKQKITIIIVLFFFMTGVVFSEKAKESKEPEKKEEVKKGDEKGQKGFEEPHEGEEPSQGKPHIDEKSVPTPTEKTEEKSKPEEKQKLDSEKTKENKEDKSKGDEKGQKGFEEPHEGEEPSQGVPHTDREPGEKPDKKEKDKEKEQKDKEQKDEEKIKEEKPKKEEPKEEKPKEEKEKKPEQEIKPGDLRPPDIKLKKPPKKEKEPGKLRKFEKSVTEKKAKDRTAGIFLFTILRSWINLLGHIDDIEKYEFVRWPYYKKNKIAIWGKDVKRNWKLDIKTSYQREVSRINGFTGVMKIRSPYFFSIFGDYTEFFEKRPEGQLERMSFSRINFNIQLPFPGTLFDFGGGIAFLKGAETNHGGNWNVGFDVFPVRPLVFHFGVSQALILDGEIFEFFGDIGFVYKRLEWFIGYRTLSPNDGPSLHGPRIGLGFWF